MHGVGNNSLKVTPEIVWGTLHGVMSLAMVVWWQGTLGYASAVRAGAGGKKQ